MATQQAGISPPERTAIIGRLPGYNTNIDINGQFVSQLLKGLTFIDLIPTSYKVNSIADGFSGELGAVDSLKQLLSAKGTPFKHDSGGQGPTKIFHQVLTGMEKGLGLDSSFSNVDSIRIIGANDSTFTENIANSFDGVNSIDGSLGSITQNSIGSKIQKLAGAYKSYSHEEAVKIFTDQNMTTSTLGQIAKGAAMGVTFARPSTWNTSQYTSTLTMFIKLVSPSGHENCVRNNILAPILYLLAAASPLTVHGFAYGLPMLWDVHAHGITRFKVGSIAAMTISRGSFETTFNDKFQPTVVDVRLTIIPLIQDFAVEHNSAEPGSMYKKGSELGVQHPGDIFSGSMNSNINPGDGGVTLPEVKVIQL